MTYCILRIHTFFKKVWMIASAQFEAYVYCGGQWGDGQRCPTALARSSRGVSGRAPWRMTGSKKVSMQGLKGLNRSVNMRSSFKHWRQATGLGLWRVGKDEALQEGLMKRCRLCMYKSHQMPDASSSKTQGHCHSAWFGVASECLGHASCL